MNRPVKTNAVKTRTVKRFLTVALLGLGLTACASKGTVKDVDLVEASYTAVDSLLQVVVSDEMRRNDLLPTRPIIVTSFVNIDNVQQSSRFGRILGEQVGSRLAQHGFKVIELKMRTSSIFVESQNGEFMLSRELKDISLEHDAQAVVVGTYAAGTDTVYVTTKAIRATDATILNSYDFSLPIGPNTKAMLRNKR
jgi:TolB-like protein